MIEIKTANLNQKNASFVFGNDVNIDEEESNLILFDIKDDFDLNNTKSNFGKIISGINYSSFVYYNDNIVFDNELYFNNRIYIDTKLKYAKTLNEEVIGKNILSEYGKAFDDKYFKKLVHDLMIRSHYNKGNFDEEGLTLFSLSLALSIYSNSIINLHNNDIDKLLKILKVNRENMYGLTVLTKCNKEAINNDLIKYFNNIFLVTKKAELLRIEKIDKSALTMLSLSEVNYEN